MYNDIKTEDMPQFFAGVACSREKNCHNNGKFKERIHYEKENYGFVMLCGNAAVFGLLKRGGQQYRRRIRIDLRGGLIR